MSKKLLHETMFCFGTCNIFMITRKSTKTIDNTVRRMINFTCLQETKWTSEMVKKLGISKFKLWYTHKVRTRNEAKIIIHKEPKKDIIYVKKSRRSYHSLETCSGIRHL